MLRVAIAPAMSNVTALCDGDHTIIVRARLDCVKRHPAGEITHVRWPGTGTNVDQPL